MCRISSNLSKANEEHVLTLKNTSHFAVNLSGIVETNLESNPKP